MPVEIEWNSALFSGGEATGNVCWKLPAEEEDLVVIWEMSVQRAERRYLSVGHRWTRRGRRSRGR